eukprot:NODE_265_length_12372_cov_0.450012.p6 type:complete len:375 gc:universal NODE_265_length_12372_cov_0.450012:7426-8550(+)
MSPGQNEQGKAKLFTAVLSSPKIKEDSKENMQSVNWFAKITSKSHFKTTTIKPFKKSGFLQSITKPDKDGMVTYTPKSPSLRHRKDIDYKSLDIYTGLPVDGLSFFKKQNAGRNDTGRITVRGKGGGMKKLVRIVDFKRYAPGKKMVIRIEKDPWRTGFLALLEEMDSPMNGEPKSQSYILATEGLKKGDIVTSYAQGLPKANDEIHENIFTTGNCFKIKDIPTGQEVCAISLNPNNGYQKLCRSAGSFAIVQNKGKIHNGIQYAQMKMKSGELRLVDMRCLAVIGRVSNSNHHNTVVGSAGRNRHLGRKPKVRGVAMNPVDHPHGGGERRGKGIDPQSRSGVLAKGGITRSKRKANWHIIKARPRGYEIRGKK